MLSYDHKRQKKERKTKIRKTKGNKEKTTNMVNTNPNVSITTSKVSDLNTPIKTRCQNGSKNKIQLYIFYKKPALDHSAILTPKKPTLNMKTDIDLKSKWMEKKIAC